VSSLSILEAAREAPQHLAVLDGAHQIDFDELAQRVRARMQTLSILAEADDPQGPAKLVASSTDASLDTLECLLALIELGRPFLPLHPRLTAIEKEQLLARLPVTWLLAAAPAAGHHMERRWPAPDARADALLRAAPQLAALATSGTGGAARVALLSRGAFIASARASAANLGWHAEDRWLLCLPLAHIGGLSVVTRCLLARRPIVLVSRDVGISSGQRLAAAVRQGLPTLLSLVPTQLDSLLELEPPFKMPASVRAIITGGAAASPRLLGAAADRGWPVLTSYGLTEACSQIATQRPGTTNRGELGAGRPLPGVSVRLNDGVIHIQGAMLSSGYLGAPDALANEMAGGFTTRDLGRFDEDGNLHVLGRIDDIIISGGENVAPWEVEAVLEACPGVLEACVFGIPDARWGEVVAAGLRTDLTDTDALVAAARGACQERLAAFKKPRFYACVSRFSQGQTGKLDRRATAQSLLAQLRPVAT
jgi:O-succinylbenzoic acid--CoA ligase